MSSIPGTPESSGWSDEEARLRRGICEVGKLCYSKSFIVGGDGNISARMSDGSLLITSAGTMKGFLAPHHIAHVDIRGELLDDGPVPSSEVGIHLVSYELRPDVKAVIHAHPPHAVAMSIAGVDLQAPIIPEVITTIGGIPTAPFATPGTHELPDSIRDIVRCSDTVIMKNHGSVCLGSNLMDAYKKLDSIEHTARILWLAQCIAGPLEPLDAESVRKLLATRAMLGTTGLNTLENRCGM
jgi:L-fuculose-phosphate aldolase